MSDWSAIIQAAVDIAKAADGIATGLVYPSPKDMVHPYLVGYVSSFEITAPYLNRTDGVHYTGEVEEQNTIDLDITVPESDLTIDLKLLGDLVQDIGHALLAQPTLGGLVDAIRRVPGSSGPQVIGNQRYAVAKVRIAVTQRPAL